MNTFAGRLSVRLKLFRSVSPGAVTVILMVVKVPGAIFVGLNLFVALVPNVLG